MPGQDCLPDAEPLDFAAFARERGEELVAALAADCWGGGLDPADVAQEALAIAYAKFATGDVALPDRLFPYVVGIGRNVARSQRGKRRRDDQAHLEAATAAARSPRRDLSDVAAENADLARAFGGLRPLYRKALLLASDGFGLDTIADLLGLKSPEAAKQVLYRARLEIKQALGSAAPCAVLPWWSWRRWTSGRTADSAASVADAAAPAAGPITQGASAMSAMTVAVALSLVAALVPGNAGPAGSPGTASAASAPPGANPLATGGGTRRAAEAPGPVPALGGRSSDEAWAPHAAAVPAPGPGLPIVDRVPVPVPTRNVPSACAPTPTNRDCAPSNGDTIRVAGLVSVTQAMVPICHRLPSLPAVTCTRQEPERWTVKDVPPVYSGGTT